MAMTPRIGMPIIPFKALDSTLEIDMSIPSEAARHPVCQRRWSIFAGRHVPLLLRL